MAALPIVVLFLKRRFATIVVCGALAIIIMFLMPLIVAEVTIWRTMQLKNDKCLPMLTKLLASRNDILRGKARYELIQFGEEAIAPLTDLLRDDAITTQHKTEAVRCIGYIKVRNNKAIEELVNIACDRNVNELLRAHSIEALLSLGHQPDCFMVTELIVLLGSDEAHIKLMSIDMLCQLGPIGEMAIPQLQHVSHTDSSQLIRDLSTDAVLRISNRGFK